MDERDGIADCIDTLGAGKGLSEAAIREGYQRFKAERHARQLVAIATRHWLESVGLQDFVDNILRRTVFDGEALSDLFRRPATGLEGAHAKGTGADGRAEPATLKARQWAGDFGVYDAYEQ